LIHQRAIYFEGVLGYVYFLFPYIYVTNYKSFFLKQFSTSIRYDEIPSDMRSESHDRRQELIEHVSNVDEVLGEIFLGKYFIKGLVWLNK